MSLLSSWRGLLLLGPSLLGLGLALGGCYLSHGASTAPDSDGGIEEGGVADGGVEDGGRSDGGPIPCTSSDPRTWTVERHNAGGDFERAVAATSGVPWIAAREADGNLVFLSLGVGRSGITIEERIELSDTPLYPIGFDTDGTRFVALTTSGTNWNGDVETVLYDASRGELTRRPWADIGETSNFTVTGGAALVGDNTVFAASRADDDVLVVELRSAAGAVVASMERPSTIGVRLIRVRDDAVELRAGANGRYRITPSSIVEEEAEAGAYRVIGGMGEYRVEHDRDFRIRSEGDLWSGPWPHTQISPPAVLREGGGRVAFSLQKELSGAVGFTHRDGLEWLHVEGALGASGVGFALLPVVEENRLGLFYLGLEIPRSDRPLRYFGVACD